MPHAPERGSETDKTVKDEWGTPPLLFKPLWERFRFTLDAAAGRANALLPRYFAAEPDGPGCLGNALETRWDWEDERYWCNPPYSRKYEFLEKGMEVVGDSKACFLLPADIVDQPDFHRLARLAAELWLLRGRVPFVGHKTGSPKFGSLLLVYTGWNNHNHCTPPVVRFYEWRKDHLL